VPAHPVPPLQPLPLDPDLTRGQLSNGLSYLLKPMANVGGAAQLELVLRVGSAAERPDEHGMAHFVEHVAFFGQRFGQLGLVPEEFIRRLGMAVGPDLNGRTSHSETSYHLVIPHADSETLAQGLDILKGFASEVRFEPDAVEQQRRVVLAELRERQEDGDSERWWNVLREVPHHERGPGGTEASLRAASPAQLEAFYRRWYRPEQLAVVAVGQFERAELLQLIEQRFASLPRGEGEAPPSFEAPLIPGEELLLREAKLERSSFEWLAKLPAHGLRSEAELRLWLLDACLATLIGARLQRLAEQPQSPFASAPDARQLGENNEFRCTALSVRVEAKPGQLRAAAEAVLGELERAKQLGFSAAELARAVATVARAFSRADAQTSVQGEAERLVALYLNAEEPIAPHATTAVGQRLLAELDPAALQARAAEWFERSRRSLLVTRAAEDSTLTSQHELEALVQSVRARPQPAPMDEAPRRLLSELPPAGQIVATEQVPELGLQVWTLQNGAQVAFKPIDSGPDLIRLRAVRPVRKVRASRLLSASAPYVQMVVTDSGVGEHDPEAVRSLLEGTSVWVEPGLSDELDRIDGGSTAADLELMLQLVHQRVTRPRADPGVLESYRAQLREPPEPSRAFESAIHDALYPADPRVTTTGVAALELDEVLRFYRERLGDVGGFTFVIVGRTNEATLRPLVERFLASLPGSPRAERQPARNDQRRPGLTRVRLPGRPALNSSVVLEFHGPFQHSARTRLELTALALQLQADLETVLKEQRNAVYSVSVSKEWSASAYTLRASFDSLPADVDGLRKATWEVIGKLSRGQISDVTLESLRARLQEGFVRERSSGEFWSQELADAYAYGMPPRDIVAVPELSASLTQNSLAAAARRYLRRDQYLDALWSAAE
jgi:zinc protease